MCYHYAIKAEKYEIEQRYNAAFEDGVEFNPVYHTNGFAHEHLPVITQDDTGMIQLYQWGPFNLYSKQNPMYTTLNAVSEEILEKKTYKTNIFKKRCLVPATGFFDWMELDKEKYPYYIETDQKIFSFAGIFNVWKDEDQITRKSFSILTTPANSKMSIIHNKKMRMPLILPSELESPWLKDDLTEYEIVNFFYPYPAEQMTAFSINKKNIFSKELHNTPSVTAMENFAGVPERL